MGNRRSICNYNYNRLGIEAPLFRKFATFATCSLACMRHLVVSGKKNMPCAQTKGSCPRKTHSGANKKRILILANICSVQTKRLPGVKKSCRVQKKWLPGVKKTCRAQKKKGFPVSQTCRVQEKQGFGFEKTCAPAPEINSPKSGSRFPN